MYSSTARYYLEPAPRGAVCRSRAYLISQMFALRRRLPALRRRHLVLRARAAATAAAPAVSPPPPVVTPEPPRGEERVPLSLSIGDTLGKLLPSNAGSAVQGIETTNELLSAGWGVVVLLGWVAAIVGAAAVSLKRRDA